MKLNNFGKRHKTFFQVASSAEKNNPLNNGKQTETVGKQVGENKSKNIMTAKIKIKVTSKSNKGSYQDIKSENKIILTAIADMMKIQKQLTKIVLDVVESVIESEVSLKFKKLVK